MCGGVATDDGPSAVDDEMAETQESNNKRKRRSDETISSSSSQRKGSNGITRGISSEEIQYMLQVVKEQIPLANQDELQHLKKFHTAALTLVEETKKRKRSSRGDETTTTSSPSDDDDLSSALFPNDEPSKERFRKTMEHIWNAGDDELIDLENFYNAVLTEIQEFKQGNRSNNKQK